MLEAETEYKSKGLVRAEGVGAYLEASVSLWVNRAKEGGHATRAWTLNILPRVTCNSTPVIPNSNWKLEIPIGGIGNS